MTTTKQEEASQEFRIADNMVIRFIDISKLKEQPINAQLMSRTKFDNLTQNIKLRGQLESLPYCYQNEKGTIEIISGHHRVRAANAAGLTRIPVIIDRQPMTRSTITAKQIAANELTGYTDEKTLSQLLTQITSVDDILLTGLDDSKFAAMDDSTTVSLNSINMKYDFKTVELTFLSKEFDEFKQFVEKTTADMTVIASSSLYQQFSDEVITYANRHNIKNVSAAITEIIRYCIADREKNTEKEKNKEPFAKGQENGSTMKNSK